MSTYGTYIIDQTPHQKFNFAQFKANRNNEKNLRVNFEVNRMTGNFYIQVFTAIFYDK